MSPATEPATDIARWSDARNLDATWSYRSERAARFIPLGATVLDIGCGKMAIEKMLAADCRYVPVDVVARDGRTIVCDLNKQEYPPIRNFTHATVLGVLEYLADPKSLLLWISHTSCLRLILSYVTLDRGMPPNARRKAGWLNDLDRDEIINLAEEAGFDLTHDEWVDNNRLFVFDRNWRGDGQAPARPNAVERARVAETRAMFGLLSYSTTNIGDEIQSVAAAQFLPATDVLVDRDELGIVPVEADERIRLILNGWHTHRPENWPPAPGIDPLFVSFHLTHVITKENVSEIRPAEALLSGKSLEYLRRHAPIGARDRATRDLLQQNGVESYFSGCLTLTLGDGARAGYSDYICAVDLPPAIGAALRSRTQSPIVHTTHHSDATGASARMQKAKRLLALYAHSKCVVTTRLHCALPCLAFGTPVLLITTARDVYRFSGLLDLLRHCSAEDFLSRGDGFDIDNPGSNSGAFLAYRKTLIRTVTRFVTGEERETPLHPFVPAEPVDLSIRESSVTPSDPFRRLFPRDRDYSTLARPDFLRDVAAVYISLGEWNEAKRLLEEALLERPHGSAIKRMLQDVARKQEAEELEEPLA